MPEIHQISYWSSNGSQGDIHQVETSILDQREIDLWKVRLDPWLRAGRPPGRGYLRFGPDVAFLRWYAGAATPTDWEYALADVGRAAELTAGRALQLPDLDLAMLPQARWKVPLDRMELGPAADSLQARARSAAAVSQMALLLAHVLSGRQRVTMPWPGPSLPEAVMWGLVTILEVIGDARRVSFLTRTSVVPDLDDGLLVAFSDRIVEPPPPGPMFERLAVDLAARFAVSPAELRQAVAAHPVHKPADHPGGQLGWLLDLPPRTGAGATISGGSPTVTASNDWSAPEEPGWPDGTSHPSTATWPETGQDRAQAGETDTTDQVTCPTCLTEIGYWVGQDRLRWQPAKNAFERIIIPANATRTERARLLQRAYVRCPGSDNEGESDHYLPTNYGDYGPPVVLGFVGLTKSGKSHLLAAMVAEMGELGEYLIDTDPLDPATHHRFLDEFVNPLKLHNQVLPGTPEDTSTRFVDAFIVSHDGGPKRVVVLMDVAGGDLVQDGPGRHFLWMASGLFFVIDPDQIAASRSGDASFTNVLNTLQSRPDPMPVSAAIVLTKADRVRFAEPAARWLRSESHSLDPVEFLRESADVYGYLYENRAVKLADPCRVCDKATLHVASPTGAGDEGGRYPRGVRPRRVLGPLVAMLAMTGVLTGRDAESVGV